jgi:hypothetical protein
MDKLAEQINHYKPLVQQIIASAETSYVFTSIDYHLQLIKDGRLAEANQNYVDEILFRFHAASVITLRRNLLWMESIEGSQRNANLFAFCASLRGLIESSADSFYSLQYVPQNLATYFKTIKSCVEGKELQRIYTFKELEDWGLHFMEAGKYQDKTLNEDHYKAKSTWEYLKSIESERALKQVYPLYQKLCQITHPSRETTYLFFRETRKYTWGVCGIDEQSEITTFVRSHDTEYELVFQHSFNTALIVLWIIDSLSIEGLQCPKIRAIDFTGIPEFNKVKKIIQSDR